MRDEPRDILADLEGPDREPAPSHKRLLATLIDFALALALLLAINWWSWPGSLPGLLRYLVAGHTLLVIFMHFALRLVTLLLLAHTPGMWVLRMELLDADGHRPTLKERLLAGCFVLYRGVDYYPVNRLIR
ncbi:MAG: hypothetical protein EOO16_27065 [Chitinophagaceae bacterium]|nr:MAG: hypothetical protein EOO16_27065 [Chitinophagaceae bacterium]